jgi:fructokinase
VVTRGLDGALVALSVTGELTSVDARKVEVVDTVGAGDSFMAGLASGLLDAGLLGGIEARERLRSASLVDVLPAVDRALACAAVTVSRAGANHLDRASSKNVTQATSSQDLRWGRLP